MTGHRRAELGRRPLIVAAIPTTAAVGFVGWLRVRRWRLGRRFDALLAAHAPPRAP